MGKAITYGVVKSEREGQTIAVVGQYNGDLHVELLFADRPGLTFTLENAVTLRDLLTAALDEN
jgi:hypothetical protein